MFLNKKRVTWCEQAFFVLYKTMHNCPFYFNEYLNIYKDVDSKVNIKGNLATAEADAYGKDTLTQTFSIATDYSSTSVSISAVG